MGMGGHILAPVPLIPMKGHPLPTERGDRWNPKAGLEGLQVRNLLSLPGKEPRSPGRLLYILVNTLIELSRPLLNDTNFPKLRYGFVAPELSTRCLPL